jgi:hypothetical protein
LGCGWNASSTWDNQEFTLREQFQESTDGSGELGARNPGCNVFASCKPFSQLDVPECRNNDGNQRSSNLFGNYADDSSSFDDASSTALVASTVYRLSLISNIHRHLPAAELSRNSLSSATSGSSNASSISNLAHFDSNGWLTPVVNPYNTGVQGTQSPEGQAFVVMMQAAWNDWVTDGSKGANAAVRLSAPFWSVFVGLLFFMFI